jgi:hypothetical protein
MDDKGTASATEPSLWDQVIKADKPDKPEDVKPAPRSPKP